MDKIKIAVLSGKGGTGKTLLSVNLASVAENSIYADCDVEEPNGHLFFKPENIDTQNIDVKIPSIDNSLCSGCRKCVEFCKFNALIFVKSKVKLLENLCHSCGGCTLFCPQKAITNRSKKIGEIQTGKSENVKIISGFLKIGEESGVPIINQMLKDIDSDNSNNITVIDSPPGTSCVVIESIKDADYCLLAAEPTIFGAHNLNMVYNLVKLFNKKCGVVLNKYTDGENPSEAYCKEKGIKIIAKIDFDHYLGKLNSNGIIVARESQTYKELFKTILDKIIKEVQL